MKKIISSVLLGCCTLLVQAQSISIKRGIIDKVMVGDSLSESFSLYLPTDFSMDKEYPVLFVADLEGKGMQSVAMFRNAAEKEGYIVAASENLSDTLSLTQNVLISGRVISKVFSILPVNKKAIYGAGFDTGARLATAMPFFYNGFAGVLSCGEGITNPEMYADKAPLSFIGIVGKEDFNYSNMADLGKVLGKVKVNYNLLTFNGGHDWPPGDLLVDALSIFKIQAMAKQDIALDANYIEEKYKQDEQELSRLIQTNAYLEAYDLVERMMQVYRLHKDVSMLKDQRKAIKSQKEYKAQKRVYTNTLYKEYLVREQLAVAVEEDVYTYNYNNLGWYTYQREQFKKYTQSVNVEEKRMGYRLLGYMDALVDENIGVYENNTLEDEEGLRYLWMLKTISAPDEYPAYLKVISNSAKNDDWGTALFYTEELLKRGYKNKAELYSLQHTELLRISPEFNEIVAKYLEDARYLIED